MRTFIEILLGVLLIVFVTVLNDTSEKLRVKNEEIRILKLKTDFSRYGISVGDTTLQVTTRLTIQREPYKYLHIKRIKKGKNEFYFVLNENTAINLIINKSK